ncbi:SOS response-associated peptidase [Nesterenkonia xinjiangensis]|uniref:Abasic site processing protein n=1 Tax=Nesterenkonia xinjiangensis TaxID=225327 RepID=A0A7Z0GQY7_9MICC|nr:SOS response-associated peptidase [Nesterenkonia xinjiangensis]NYJ79498.1 putative SOS response-associated peptidase YedK [Nesterenkonia xinjiangensis]
MCGRYVMALRAGDLIDALEACGIDDVALAGPATGVDASPAGPEQSWRVSWNVAPTSTVPILVERYEEGADEAGTHAGRQREIHPARWGLLPRWAETAAFSSKTFNARSETVVSKPSFRSAVRRRRCVVPVQGYYEWKVSQEPQTGKTVRVPHLVRDRERPLILFAGLYEWWKDPEREAQGRDAWVLSTTILTGPSPDVGEDGAGPAHGDRPVLTELAQLHDRLPLAMSADEAADWIAPGERSREDTEADVERLRLGAVEVARGWTLHEVDRAVGNVRNDSPELIRPPDVMF